ncbi:MAG TPA: hypothetical protein VFM87_03915, partial [Agrococcus sp.]|nr:hypothetical protein [Agrococcus sp.]
GAGSDERADAPVLLSVDTRAGHGMGKPKDAAALEFADQLAFAAHHTGLVVDGAPAETVGAGSATVPASGADGMAGQPA